MTARTDNLTTTKRVGAVDVVDFLVDHGHSHVFGLPGSSMVSIHHHLQDAPIEYVPAVHESAAVAIADGYARVAGAACTLLYMLPGMGNGISNLSNAWSDETPLMILASQQSTRYRTVQATVGEADLVGLTRPWTRLSAEVSPSSSLTSWLDRASRAAQGPPSGPTFLSLPEDVLEQPATGSDTATISGHRAEVHPDVRRVADSLASSTRPLLVVGGQARRLGASELIEQLAATHEVPVCYEPMWNDRLAIAPSHSHALGSLMPNSPLAADADTVVIVGARHFHEAHPSGAPWFPNARLIAHVNADPAKLDAVYPAHWTAAAHARPFLEALQRELATRPAPDDVLDARRAFIDQGRRYVPPLRGYAAPAATALADVLSHTWLVDESVTASNTLLAALDATDGSRYVSSSGASLGWAAGAACGVALASGDPVTCTLGDGALLFGVHGLWTARALSLPITYVVIDNGGYGSTRFFERKFIGKTFEPGARDAGYLGSDLRSSNVGSTAVLEGFGIPTSHVPLGGDIRAALEAAWASAAKPNAVVIEASFD